MVNHTPTASKTSPLGKVDFAKLLISSFFILFQSSFFFQLLSLMVIKADHLLIISPCPFHHPLSHQASACSSLHLSLWFFSPAGRCIISPIYPLSLLYISPNISALPPNCSTWAVPLSYLVFWMNFTKLLLYFFHYYLDSVVYNCTNSLPKFIRMTKMSQTFVNCQKSKENQPSVIIWVNCLKAHRLGLGDMA